MARANDTVRKGRRPRKSARKQQGKRRKLRPARDAKRGRHGLQPEENGLPSAERLEIRLAGAKGRSEAARRSRRTRPQVARRTLPQSVRTQDQARRAGRQAAFSTVKRPRQR